MDGLLLAYLAGVAAALVFTDARLVLRLVLAVLWPVGPIAFAATVSLLLAASLIAFPAVALVAGAAGLLWWVVG